MVLGRGFEPRSPALQAGAFTRLAFRASARSRASCKDGAACENRTRVIGEALRGPANRPRPHGGCPENRTRHAHRRRFYRPAQSPDLTTPEDLATPDWLQRTESNGLPRGYESRELPMLHAASKVARLELTRMRRSTSVRSQNWRTAEVLIPNALRHPSRFERAHGTRRVDCPWWWKTANSNRTPVKVPAAFQAVPVRLPG